MKYSYSVLLIMFNSNEYFNKILARLDYFDYLCNRNQLITLRR